MSNIYLVGFMGTGKTSVGRELARRWKCPFVDLDDLIELKEKRTIADLFAKEGEPYFRRAEKRALSEVSREKGFVVACGGGVVIDAGNIKAMKDTGKIFCLAARPEVILSRTCGCSHRPLLNVNDPIKRIELLLKMRSPYYAQADKTIDTSGLSVAEVVERILAETRNQRTETRRLKTKDNVVHSSKFRVKSKTRTRKHGSKLGDRSS